MGFDVGGALVGGISGFMAGGPAGAAVGALGGGFMSGGGGSAPQIAQPNPMDVNGPFGSVVFDSSGMNLTESSGMQDSRLQLQDAMRAGLANLSPAQQQLVFAGQMGGQNLLGMGQDIAGLSGNVGVMGQRIGGLQNQLGFNQGFLSGLDPNLAGAQGQLFGAGGQALGQGMAGLGAGLDPDAIAAQQMGRMQALLAPGREQTRLRSEGRTLRQGLLGSTAGQNRQAALETSFAQQDAGLAANALQQGLGAQQQQFGQGVAQAQLGQGLFGAGAGAIGQRAALQGQSAGLTGQQAQLFGQQAGLSGMQAGLLGQQAGMISGAQNLLGTGVNMEQLSRGNFFQNLAGQQTMQNMLQSQAGLGMGILPSQTAVNMQNAQNQFSANQNQADMQNALLFGGMQAGMQSGFNFGDMFSKPAVMSQPTTQNPMLMMQQPFGAGAASELGLGFNPMQGVF